MPFPRCKANLYDEGTRVPLAIRLPPRVPGGRVVSDMVSLKLHRCVATIRDVESESPVSAFCNVEKSAAAAGGTGVR